MVALNYRKLACALLLALFGAQALAAAESPARRRFAMGFTPFAWDSSPEAVQKTNEFILRNGDLVAHHLDNGVPWTEALEGRPFHENLEAEWARRKEMSRGKRIFLSLTPLDGGRKEMARYRGKDENMPLPEEFRGKALDDAVVKTAYLAYCRRAVEHFRPDHLAIGIEVNELILNAPERWPPFLALYRETRSALKESRPGLPICATVTLHALADPAKRTRNGQEAKVRAFLDECDFAGISYYPFMMGNMTRPEEPLDWLRGFTAKPIAVAESGFPAETLTLSTFRLTLPSSPGLQEAFLEKLLGRAERDGYLFVAWFLHRDYDDLWEKIKGTAPEFFKAWKDCGLLDGAGAGRPALDVWKRFFLRPVAGARRL